jgi:hypothetical protein
VSALDDAREFLGKATAVEGRHTLYNLLAALVAECEEYHSMVAFAASAFESGEDGAAVLRAFLAKVEGA